jgi:hypothetical protein
MAFLSIRNIPVVLGTTFFFADIQTSRGVLFYLFIFTVPIFTSHFFFISMHQAGYVFSGPTTARVHITKESNSSVFGPGFLFSALEKSPFLTTVQTSQNWWTTISFRKQQLFLGLIHSVLSTTKAVP